MNKLTINHLPIGSEVFYLEEKYEKRICDKCNGTKELIINVKDEAKKVKCAYCGDDGKVTTENKVYKVVSTKIIGATLYIMENSNNLDYYLNDYTFKKNDEIYLTKKSAQRKANILNGKLTTMNISDIKIHESMKEHPPKLNKLMDRDTYYKEHGEFSKPVHIDKHGYIADGYITYLLCKIYGLDEVPVLLLGGDR